MTADPRLAGRRVCFVIHEFDRGGSGRVAAYLARGFAERGMIVDVLVFCRGGTAESACAAIAGPDVAITYFARRRRTRTRDLALGLPQLVRCLRERRPDIVIGAANNVALVTATAVRLARLHDTRCYLKTTNPVASSRHRGIARRIRRAGYRAAFRRADAVWTLSQDEAAEMVAAFPAFAGRFRAVINPYVTPAMLAVPAAVRPPSDVKRIIAIARLTHQKRLERLIAALAQVHSTDAELLILGEGEEREALERLVRDHGLAGRVAMPGHVADVATALHASHLLVMTSDYEGLPAAVLEAMAADCPVLATDCFPAARTLLESAEGCAVIADPAPLPLARQIDAHLSRPRPTQLHLVAERFSIENGIASHYAALLDDARG